MDEQNNQEDPIEEQIEEEELGITDKMVGVLTEPSTFFKKIANLPLKSSDWLIPLIIAIVITMISSAIMMTNPAIKADMQEKQMKQVEKYFQEQVDKGAMTQAQADQIMDQQAQRMEQGSGLQLTIAMISIPIIFFIVFFIIAGVYFLLSKFALKGDGTYKTTLSAYGLSYYVVIIQAIVIIIVAIALGKMLRDVSVGSLMGMDSETLGGWFMHRLDIFSIWLYSVISIALAKMFKSENTLKYFIGVFGLWIGFSLLFHFVGKAVPFLKAFGL